MPAVLKGQLRQPQDVVLAATEQAITHGAEQEWGEECQARTHSAEHDDKITAKRRLHKTCFRKAAANTANAGSLQTQGDSEPRGADSRDREAAGQARQVRRALCKEQMVSEG